MTHPGVGPLTALATVLVLGPVTRFPTSKHVVSYIGLAPSVAASAAKSGWGISPSKATPCSATSWGKPARSPRSDPDLRRLYSGVMHRHGRAKAKVAVARKLLVRLYIMARDQIDYAEFRARGRRPLLARVPRSPSEPDIRRSHPGGPGPQGTRSSAGVPELTMVAVGTDLLIGTPTLDDLDRR